MPDEHKPPIIEYRRPQPRWRHKRGPDTFIGSAGLLFAIISLAQTLITLGFGLGVFIICSSSMTLLFSIALSLAAMCIPYSSRTFPLAALGIDVVLIAMGYFLSR